LILLLSVVVGALTGWGLARWQGRIWQPPSFQYPALLVIGFLPQWLAFYFEPTRRLFSDEVASACLVLSQTLLLGFAGLNISLSGLPFLALGLALNLLVIVANGGFMPLVAESAARLLPQDILNLIGYGERISHASKDILMMESAIRFPWLADRFVSPDYFSYRFIFSLGDVWIAIGAFLLLAVGRKHTPQGALGKEHDQQNHS